MKRPRLKKWAKWTCTLAAGAAVALAVVSRFDCWVFSVKSNSGRKSWSLGILSGRAWLARVDNVSTDDQEAKWGWRAWRYDDWCWGYAGEDNPHVGFGKWHAGVLYAPGEWGFVAGASMLYPVALTLIPAALLWYADRRRARPGLCGGCGYDRAGLLVEVKCPECGTVPARG